MSSRSKSVVREIAPWVTAAFAAIALGFSIYNFNYDREDLARIQIQSARAQLSEAITNYEILLDRAIRGIEDSVRVGIVRAGAGGSSVGGGVAKSEVEHSLALLRDQIEGAWRGLRGRVEEVSYGIGANVRWLLAIDGMEDLDRRYARLNLATTEALFRLQALQDSLLKR